MWIGIVVLLMVLVVLFILLEKETQKTRRIGKAIFWLAVVLINALLWLWKKHDMELEVWIRIWLVQGVLLGNFLPDLWQKEVNPIGIYSFLPAAILYRLLFWQEGGIEENGFRIIIIVVGLLMWKFSKEFLQGADYFVLLLILMVLPVRDWLAIFVGSLVLVVLLGGVHRVFGKKTKEFPYLPIVSTSFGLWLLLNLINY